MSVQAGWPLASPRPGILSSLALSAGIESGSIALGRGGAAPSFTRATAAHLRWDWEGKPTAVLSGEARFPGFRREYNQVGNTGFAGAVANSVAPTGWTRPATGGTFAPAASSYYAGHSRLDFTVNNNREIMAYQVNLEAGKTYILSAHIEAISGTFSDSILTLVGVTATLSTGSGLTGAIAVAAGAGRRMVNNVPFVCTVSGTATFRIGLGCGALETGNCSVSISAPMLHDVTGRSNQNPSEYVSNGVLAAPYHGAGVDGVRYFNTTNGNSVSSNVVTERTGEGIPLGGLGWGYFPINGVGNTTSISTPSTVSNQVLGDCTVKVQCYFGNVTDTNGAFLGKRVAGTAEYVLRLSAAKRLQLFWFEGGVLRSAGALVDFSAASGQLYWFKASRTMDVAGGTATVSFYESVDGVTWTQIGPSIAVAITGLATATAADVRVGCDGGGTPAPPSGLTVRRAQVFASSSDTGAPVVDFNPTLWSSGSTFSGPAGETWTLNGGATIAKFPRGYHAEEASGNLVLSPEDFSASWVPVGTPTRVAAAKRCGSVVLDLIGDDNAAALEGYAQSITFTAGTRGVSVFFAQGSSTSSAFNIDDAGTARLFGTLTWTNGVPSIAMTIGTLLGIDYHGDGVWRARMLATGVLAVAQTIAIYPACNAAVSVALTGTLYVGGVMAENKAFCSAYTSLTTRNADQLSYSGGYDTGSIYARVVPFLQNSYGAAQYICEVGDGSGNERVALYREATTAAGQFAVVDGGSLLANQIGATLGVDASSKLAGRWQLNNVNLAVNGVSVAADTGCTMPTTTNVYVAYRPSSAHFHGLIQDLKIWSRALSDAELAAITT